MSFSQLSAYEEIVGSGEIEELLALADEIKGISVTEALWKARPVIGGNAGGIVLQIKDGESGFLVNSIEEAIDKVVYLLRNPSYGREMGEAGKKVVKDKFLITRHLKDYLRLIGELCS